VGSNHRRRRAITNSRGARCAQASARRGDQACRPSGGQVARQRRRADERAAPGSTPDRGRHAEDRPRTTAPPPPPAIDRRADRGEAHPFPEHEAAHVRRGRPQGDANGDLGVALAHVGGHDRVQPDRREQQRGHAEDADEEGVESRSSQRSREQLCECGHLRDFDARVSRLHTRARQFGYER
jgi:hypothetical protein